jgi:hypothetical protein
MALLRRFVELRKARLLQAWRLEAERARLWRRGAMVAWREVAVAAREVRYTAAHTTKRCHDA